MLSNQIKEATKEAHQQLEKTVVLQIKAIRTPQDYAAFLTYFYAYFTAVEKAIAPFITEEILPDYAARRNASYIGRDIEELGSNTSKLPTAHAPAIADTAEALGALYVLEGSIMGGPYIIQMLQKQGIQAGFSFFSGYGQEAGQMWGRFVSVLNQQVNAEADRERAVLKAEETFHRFGEVFEQAQNAFV